MIVTTSARRQEELIEEAQEVAMELKATFVPRGKRSVEGILKKYVNEDVLLVTKDGLKLVQQEQESPHHQAGDEAPSSLQEPFFFHPSSAMFRLKRLLRGEQDPFIEATGLKRGDSILDATLGLASDAIIAAFTVGEQGKVVGVESNPVLAFMVAKGLQSWETDSVELKEAMARVEVIQADHMPFLASCPDRSFDVVYVDPMFESSVASSTGLSGLKRFANYAPFSKEALQEAKRVARKRVVMKESSYSARFEELGFTAIERKYASHWFGVIEL
ncbi:class I SAM-dependent methyltransferase [Bacillus horti]|uniref:Ubiquinone/menaquinone biosynthesis C-methylase UbiE n=1 Tax=Caldalkalibacillus horti TaxID=77523 RepID=A0ABT9VVG6_9BACI|nr:class I SAM-dependent methyltransferase [Bacillus horti]MDQ0164822.1 ubiquinone/menaquinone biosynthesis C-methylase UbiE [Bacillus horti]